MARSFLFGLQEYEIWERKEKKKVKERRKQPVKDEEENKKNSMPLYYPDSKRLERTFNRFV